MGIFTKVAIAIALAAGIAAGLLGYMLKNEIESHAITKVELTTATAAIENLQQSIVDMQAAQNSLDGKTKELQLELNDAVRQLDSFRNREHILMAKPGLVEIKINKAFEKEQKYLACITGDIALCLKKS